MVIKWKAALCFLTHGGTIMVIVFYFIPHPFWTKNKQHASKEDVSSGYDAIV